MGIACFLSCNYQLRFQWLRAELPRFHLLYSTLGGN